MQYLGRLFLHGGADKAFEGLEIILVKDERYIRDLK